MKMNMSLKSLSMKNPLEMVLLALFIIYLVFPISTPRFLAPLIDSSLGMVVIFAIILFLFMYSHPLLAIIYVLVAYELIRRSTVVSGRTAYIQYTPTQAKRDESMRAMNPPQEVTLEEDMVTMMAPMGQSGGDYLETAFRPVSDNIHQASMI
jgi:predicted membrane protein